MDVKTINPILEAFTNILPQIGFQTVEKKGVSLAASPLQYQGILINIGVLGPLQGAILIGMDTASAKQFASKMMMGMGIEGLDISPPTLLIGNDGQVRLAVPNVIVVEFAVDNIKVMVYVGVYNK
ncbi:MAG: putative inhibitor of methylation, CheC [Firmicutes bacterium]|nr:putative inhibitor of methylation, CheC [Bacillota bacterium]